MKKSKKILALAIAGMMTLPMAAQVSVSAASAKDTLVIAEQADCGTMAPTGATIECRSDICLQVYDGLFRFDGSHEIYPQLATDWEWIDTTHVKFNLRQGVKYHDGRDFTASDVLFTLKLNVEDANTTAAVTNLDLDACEVVDDYTIIIAFNKQDAFNFSKLSFLNIVNEEAYNESGDGMATHPVGTGAYKFESSVPGASYTFTANEEYWDTTPSIQTLTFNIIAEASQRTNALLAGEIDVNKNLQTSDYEYIGGMDGFEVGSKPAFNSECVFFDMTEGSPFAVKELRQAVGYAIDNEAMNQAAYAGMGFANTGAWSSGMADYDATWTHPMYEGPDMEKAKELVASVGAPTEPITILYGGNAAEETVTQILQANLAELGITAEIVSVDSGVFWSAMADQSQWDLGVMSCSAPSGYGLDSMTAFLTGLNFQGWSGENFDKLVELCAAGAGAATDEERLDYTKQLWDLVEEEMPIYAMVTLTNQYAYVDSLNYFVFDQYSMKANELTFE